MTATATASVRSPNAAVLAAAAGCAALVARPLFLRSTTTAVVLFTALLAVGAMWPATQPLWARHRASNWRGIAPASAVGLVAFALGRLIGGGHPPTPFAGRFIALSALAAVAEEAFFRRLVYGALARHGPVAAVAGSTVLFALAHVTVYGWWVLPIDLAAGLVLSWQRWSTGGWTVPAITHVLANVLVVI
ncbi:MAG: Type prenyl endopeptidase Rce1-like [Actinomycetota bacterium]